MKLLKTPEGAFLALGAAFGLLFVFLIPPFQAPDEPAHFYRAYGISEGRLLPRRWMGTSGDELPQGLITVARRFARISGNADVRTTPDEILSSRSVRLSAERLFIAFPSTATYPAVSFLPQSAGISFGRLVSSRALDLLYAARLVNLAVSLVLLTLAIRSAPFGQWILTLLALMPMSMFLRSSASPDALITASAFLVFALSLKIVFSAQDRHTDLSIFIGAAALLASSKPYFPLALILLTSRKLRRRPIVVALLLAAVGIGTLALLLQASHFYVSREPESIDPERQLSFVAAHPMQFAQVAATDYLIHAPRYAAHFVGRLGWLDTPLPLWLVLAYAVFLFAYAFTDGSPDQPLPPSHRIFIAALTVMTLLIVTFSLYLMWTPVGSRTVEGIQGRYFIPIAPAAAILLTNRRFAVSSSAVARVLIAAVALTASLLITTWVILHRYYAV